MRRAAAALACLTLAGAAAAGPAAAQDVPDLVARDALRVCSDPAFLPFSSDRGEGFENRIAEVIGTALGLPVIYTWYPQTSGFLRNTLLAQRCDVVMGINSGGGEAATTPAYYHTGYMIVTRQDDAITATSLDDPALAGLRFGVVAATPPSDLLVAHELIPQTKVYPLLVDTRTDSPAMDMMHDVADGAIDVGLVWGPFAGWAITQGLRLHADFLRPEPGHPRLDYMIAMGVRPGDTDWARRLAAAQRAHAAEIRRILTDAGVPLLDPANHPLFVPAPATVPEPAGYRLDHYRAPTPETVRGATVIDTAGLRELLDKGGAVALDVLPAPRQPAGMKPGTPWSPLRRDIPGSVWLPDLGQATPTPAMEAWFRARLRALTGGDLDRPVVVYCLDQCWLSWNAARRVAEYGWRHVLWYRGGTDAWARAGLALARATPDVPPDAPPDIPADTHPAPAAE
jgi:quinoprotein dehydrogenase-associated probable ABC transporter substrate-binding protein/PQQ-dependent catabolism-associated CXXCW motif protein